jgi:hypothetical protein
MKITARLDPDVERLVKQAARERGVSFKQALNDSVRAGAVGTRTAAKRFIQETFAMGSEQDIRWEKALGAAESMEDEYLGGKLALRK